MSSRVVDPEVVEQEEVNEVTLEDTLDNTVEPVEEIEAVSEEPELPSKFQGKSAADIADAYENLEKELGRKGQEIGELRKLTDTYLQQQLSQPTTDTTSTEPEMDFYDNPEDSVRKIIENHPKFKEFTAQTQQQQANMTAQQLEKTHPDFQKIISDGGFQEWISGSKIRQRLYQGADQYNFDAADELITNWKERQMISKTQEVNAEQESNRKEALKTGNGVSRASGESTAGKKIYRRADLIRLKQTDPRRYDSLADEILAAYAEGRVK